ncbi:CHRNN [Mytilus coruscus]|uniref:CHRNN n=1 Tax=Mytilus coruscus TaxID=42192 RepID=A0A6J8BHN6_MYTCO|nr:CHRNN [Mytilus coruscus]
MFGIKDSYVIIHNSGTVTWQPGHQLEFSCNIDTTYFPFDTQKCTLEVISWGYNMGDISFTPTSSYINTLQYVENSEWKLTFTSVASEDGPPPNTKFLMHFQRRPLYLIINLIFPVILLALLNITVFLLPQDSGERVGFAITLLLSIVVFLTIAQGLLPATAQPRLSAICIVLILNMVMSGMITVSVIVSGWIYYKPEYYDVPNWIKKIIHFKLYRRRTNKNQIHVQTVQNEKTIDKPPIDGDESKVTWQMVAKYYDRISLIFYVICFMCGHVFYAIDVVKGG